MLDERREFAEYTADLTAKNVPRRLRYKKLTDELSSIRRAMTIVARGALDGRNDDKHIAFAKDCLRLWCGHAALGDGEGDVRPAEAETDLALQRKLRDWLPRYLDLLGEDKVKEAQKKREKERGDGNASGGETPIGFPEKVEKTKRTLAANAKRYSQPELKAEGEEPQSNLNAITYEGVIADALEAGPLRTRYLVVTSGKDEQALFQGVYKNATSAAGPKSHAATARTQILKLTAMVLQASRSKTRPAAGIKLANAENYLKAAIGCQEKNDPGIFGLLTLDGSRIFEKETLSNSVVLLRMNPAWLERGGFVLAEEDELKNYPGALYYGDGDWAETHLVSGVVEA